MQDWILRLWYGVFVLWGYGPLTGDSDVIHVGRDRVYFSLDDKCDFHMFFDFELPEYNPESSRLPAPQEYERKICWGYSLIHTGTLMPLDWHIADSKIDAYKKGRQSAKNGGRNGLNIVRVTIQQNEAKYAQRLHEE